MYPALPLMFFLVLTFRGYIIVIHFAILDVWSSRFGYVTLALALAAAATQSQHCDCCVHTYSRR